MGTKTYQQQFDETVLRAKQLLMAQTPMMRIEEYTPPPTGEELRRRSGRLLLMREPMFFLGKDVPEFGNAMPRELEDKMTRAAELWHWAFYGLNEAYPKTLLTSSTPFYGKGQAEIDWQCTVESRARSLEEDRLYSEAYHKQPSGFGWAEVKLEWRKAPALTG